MKLSAAAPLRHSAGAVIRIQETTRTLPFYRPAPLTNLPLIYHREHLFPYASYGATETTPVSRAFRMVALENEFLRVEVAPELGGRVYSLFDKRIGKEILFSNPVVKPVRILPIWGFISGGIEFNFPIAHSPTSIAEVGCATGRVGDYGFVRVGEREARTGMEWVVELGLVEGSPALVQRTAFRNHTGAAHPWMSWTIAAVRSTEGTEFVHPPHRVLVHDDRVVEADWPGEGLNWDRNAKQMTALFWKPGSAPQFGAFHHDLGFGLMHLADPAQLPGKKLWTYGHGRHRGWGQGTTEGGFSYCEIESGPLLVQSEKPMFPRGTERRYEEFWVPVHSREACDRAEWPKLKLPPMSDSWLGWRHSAWQTEWEKFRIGEGLLPVSTVVTGIDLEAALHRELERGNTDATQPLALWLAFHGRPEEALQFALTDPSQTSARLAGVILWKALGQPVRAVAHLEAGPLHDPVAVVELDELYAELGLTAQRAELLARAPQHRLVIERRADLALAGAKPAETLRLLTETPWPREHQRYVRTELWKKAKAVLGEPDADVPDFLNEDNLARFGAYWSDQ
ncbi:MAG: DUF5107 domain-containing protein [Verrucomicrobia bacterium]|nr:DUF5107 domain-containing protein [Verrucomicrobiota bacterium]